MSNEYSGEKLRVPSWCDRILWKSLPNCVAEQQEYSSCETILTSDHHPIYATYTVKTRRANWPHVPKSCGITFSELESSGLGGKDNADMEVSLQFICDSFSQPYSSAPVLKV